jgi:HK97 family phage major capsid protein
MVDIIAELQERLVDLNERAQVIQAAADAERRSLASDEQTEIDRIFTEFKSVESDIARRQEIMDQTNKLRQPLPRIADPNDPEPPVNLAQPQAGTEPQAQPRRARSIIATVENRGKMGFRGFGEFAQAVKNSVRGGLVDPRLVLAHGPGGTTTAQEGVGADGGFLVPPDFRSEIWTKVTGEDSLLGRTDQQTSSRNTMVWPADETTPWQTSGGIKAYWESEAGQKPQSKLALQEKTIRLNKLTALVPVTEELLEDASGLDSYLRKKVAEKFDFQITLKILQGLGAGEPLGILNSPCLVSVGQEVGQPADTLVAENVINMWSRMYAPSRRNAVWLINQDIEPQLLTMAFRIPNAAGTDFVGGVPVYMPPNGLAGSPYGTLLGRPVIPTQACNTLGDQGDIILADLKQYLTAVKTGGLRTDVSMHLWFDYDVIAYRFVLRLAGQPWWNAAIAPRVGANTLSCFVTLDERAGGGS